MREGQFIRQNKDRWATYEEPTEDPDEMAAQFTHLVDDLAYAKTFYPTSNTTRYLNGLGANLYLSIYRNRREPNNRLITFWTRELPLIVHRHHRILLFAFLFFAVFVAFGAFSQAYDQTFVRAILGDGYVDMTEQNIARGDPFGVYKDGDSLYMFVRIAYNNIRVSMYCFMLGIVLSLGTLYFLLSNGVMLGAFEYMFFQHGVGGQSILVIFIHGTLEISAIVISGAAGMVMGNSFLFPGTLTRMQSLKRGAKDGAKMVVALIPIFLVAAFFESYVTRHTDMPLPLSLLILGGSLFFILFYFVYYPIKVARAQAGVAAIVR